MPKGSPVAGTLSSSCAEAAAASGSRTCRITAVIVAAVIAAMIAVIIVTVVIATPLLPEVFAATVKLIPAIPLFQTMANVWLPVSQCLKVFCLQGDNGRSFFSIVASTIDHFSVYLYSMET